jgi:hypothetical protein
MLPENPLKPQVVRARRRLLMLLRPVRRWCTRAPALDKGLDIRIACHPA